MEKKQTLHSLQKDKIVKINNQIGSGNRVKRKVGKNDKQERADKIITFRDQLFEINIKDFFNSEIVGNYTNSNFGVIFLNRSETLPRHPAQLYESFGYLILFIILYTLYPNTSQIKLPAECNASRSVLYDLVLCFSYYGLAHTHTNT